MAESPLDVLTPAGPIHLRLEDSVYLTGPAEIIAEGEFFGESLCENEDPCPT
jgi:diaminopimelate epimerase